MTMEQVFAIHAESNPIKSMGAFSEVTQYYLSIAKTLL